LTVSLALAIPLSIDFAHGLDLDPAPLKAPHQFPLTSNAKDGPVTVTTELIIRWKDREQFLALTKELRLISLRNGATFYRVEESMEHPGAFRIEMRANTWGEYVRQRARTAKAENEIAERVLAMHSGEHEVVIRHRLGSVAEMA
jgi:hypothetical protein